MAAPGGHPTSLAISRRNVFYSTELTSVGFGWIVCPSPTHAARGLGSSSQLVWARHPPPGRGSAHLVTMDQGVVTPQGKSEYILQKTGKRALGGPRALQTQHLPQFIHRIQQGPALGLASSPEMNLAPFCPWGGGEDINKCNSKRRVACPGRKKQTKGYRRERRGLCTHP